MIVRRMLLAVKGQDWSTLFIELPVVVVGIFLGLRANYASRGV